MFKFKSDLVLSKSWLNRALIIQNYAPDLNLKIESDSDDVLVLKKAISEVESKKEFNLGQGGTSFRFFCFLISRHAGHWIIKAHPRLLERPQLGMQSILNQLGVKIEFHVDHIMIHSTGWNVPEKLISEARDSSQFISALLLNSWNLDQDLKLEIQGPIVSEDYLKMTIQMVQQFGMNLQQDGHLIHVRAGQTPRPGGPQPEVDVSSAFALAAAAVVAGDAEMTNWTPKAIQPDLIFLKIFDLMKIKYAETQNSLRVEKQNSWNGVSVNLNRSPDLFPVLAVLCALADGTSDLFGAAQLKHKESDRLRKTKELLDLTGFHSELKPDGLLIYGRSSAQDKSKKLMFNPDHDHRMAMAAGLLMLAGYQIVVSTPEVVQKSYKSFWKDVGISR